MSDRAAAEPTQDPMPRFRFVVSEDVPCDELWVAQSLGPHATIQANRIDVTERLRVVGKITNLQPPPRMSDHEAKGWP